MLRRPHPAQILKKTGMFSEEYCNTPLGETKIPVPKVVLIKIMLTWKNPSALKSCRVMPFLLFQKTKNRGFLYDAFLSFCEKQLPNRGLPLLKHLFFIKVLKI